MKVKPSLPLPEQYVEIGLWRQVMQMNQKVCHKMEGLEKVEGSFPDDTEVWFAQNLRSKSIMAQQLRMIHLFVFWVEWEDNLMSQ